MTADPITATADMAIEDAAKTMFDHGFRHLPIVDGERAVGIVSIRDVAEWGIARAVEADDLASKAVLGSQSSLVLDRKEESMTDQFQSPALPFGSRAH